MIVTSRKCKFLRFNIILIFLIFTYSSFSQVRKLVWADEFNGTEIDQSIWKFGIGTTNDNIHYYTDRSENAQIYNGKLHIIALKESYKGLNFTSALIETSRSVNWKYGRVEARIKVPGTRGFVPAFWMLPTDNIYGFWPLSGEIDIMEYPTTKGKTVYGTVHNKTSEIPVVIPSGDTIHVSDAESQFHLYSIEWTDEQINFYVDDQKYYTYNNDHSNFETWPFNQPFYIILNLAVGGGWVGEPDVTTLFPAVMEVDYVRAYQYESDMAITGPDFLPYNSQSATYSFPKIDGVSYSWELPGNAEILSNLNSSQINLNWNIFGGVINTQVNTGEGTYNVQYPVDVSYNLLKNPGFEKGVKYWNANVGFPASAEIIPDILNMHEGETSLLVNVKVPGTNAWDIQLTQRDIPIIKNNTYTASFWAKTNGGNGQLNAAIINSADHSVYVIKTVSVTGNWTQFELVFIAQANAIADFNIDLGTLSGYYYLDDFIFTTPELFNYNQLTNADFERKNNDWYFNLLFPAVANGDFKDGEYGILIDNGGVNVWDLHLGQSNITVEKGEEYIVSFDAYAAEPRTISTFVGKNSDPWTFYSGNNIISLTTTKQRYSYSFVMKEPSDLQARFGFDVGVSTINVFFDNVFLGQEKLPTAINKVNLNQESLNLCNIYPNPVYDLANVLYKVPEISIVNISVYDIFGRKIKELVNEVKNTGEYEVTLDASDLLSGIYMICLRTGENTYQSKMIAIK